MKRTMAYKLLSVILVASLAVVPVMTGLTNGFLATPSQAETIPQETELMQAAINALVPGASLVALTAGTGVDAGVLLVLHPGCCWCCTRPELSMC